MGRAKEILVKPISATDARRIIRALHYSGKVVNNSRIHLGVFLDGRCGGAMQFGPSLDKRKLVGLVRGTLWNEFLELNRLAFADWLPRNGESRALGYAMRWLRKTYPWLKWVVSFADATQCGDGTIYRASGFILTGISQGSMWYLPPDLAAINGGPIAHRMKLQDKSSILAVEVQRRTRGKNCTIDEYARRFGGRIQPGHMLRYIYFLDPAARERLTVPILPFSEIERRGAGMYRGKPRSAGSIDADAPACQAGEGGSTPTPALQETGIRA